MAAPALSALLAAVAVRLVLVSSRRRLRSVLPGTGDIRISRLGKLRRRRAAADIAAEDLALVADLLGAALQAGEPLDRAMEVVISAVPTEWGERFLADARLAIATASVPEDASARGEPVARVLRAMRRSSTSGARLAVQLRLLADDIRAVAAASTLERARRVAVLAVLPLGLCCLPAFMLLAVVPLVAGLAKGLGG